MEAIHLELGHQIHQHIVEIVQHVVILHQEAIIGVDGQQQVEQHVHHLEVEEEAAQHVDAQTQIQ